MPSAVARCDDTDVTGAPFYVMGFVDGTILRTEADGAALAPDHASAATASLVDVQVAMHALDPSAIDLGDLGRPGGYVERQLHRWHTQVERAKVRDLPLLDELHARGSCSRCRRPRARRRSRMATTASTTRCWAPDHRVTAVLDWELCTTGDAVADFAWSLLYWADPGDPCPFLASSPTLAPVLPRRAEVADLYAARSGRDLADLDWFSVFGFWKMACIVEGVFARRQRGARGGGAAGSLDSIVARTEALLDHAQELARSALR